MTNINQEASDPLAKELVADRWELIVALRKLDAEYNELRGKVKQVLDLCNRPDPGNVYLSANYEAAEQAHYDGDVVEIGVHHGWAGGAYALSKSIREVLDV